MVNGDKIIGEIMLVVFSNLLFTHLYLQMSVHTGLSDNCDVGATTLLYGQKIRSRILQLRVGSET